MGMREFFAFVFNNAVARRSVFLAIDEVSFIFQAFFNLVKCKMRFWYENIENLLRGKIVMQKPIDLSVVKRLTINYFNRENSFANVRELCRECFLEKRGKRKTRTNGKSLFTHIWTTDACIAIRPIVYKLEIFRRWFLRLRGTCFMKFFFISRFRCRRLSHRGNIAEVIKRLSFGVRVDNRLPRRRTADSTKLWCS